MLSIAEHFSLHLQYQAVCRTNSGKTGDIKYRFQAAKSVFSKQWLSMTAVYND